MLTSAISTMFVLDSIIGKPSVCTVMQDDSIYLTTFQYKSIDSLPLMQLVPSFIRRITVDQALQLIRSHNMIKLSDGVPIGLGERYMSSMLRKISRIDKWAILDDIDEYDGIHLHEHEFSGSLPPDHNIIKFYPTELKLLTHC